jgi:hypothetical protein
MPMGGESCGIFLVCALSGQGGYGREKKPPWLQIALANTDRTEWLEKPVRAAQGHHPEGR